MSKTREILKALMAAAGHSTPALHRKSGVPAQTINRFLAGRHGEPKTGTIQKWAAVYNVSESQMRGDVPIEGIDAPNPDLKKVLSHQQQKILDAMENLDDLAQHYLMALAELLRKDPSDRRIMTPDNVADTAEQRIGEKNYTEKASGGKYRPSVETDLFPDKLRPGRKRVQIL